MIDHNTMGLMQELQLLTETLKGLGGVEAAMRLRALSELSQQLGTDALLDLVSKITEPQR